MKLLDFDVLRREQREYPVFDHRVRDLCLFVCFDISFLSSFDNLFLLFPYFLVNHDFEQFNLLFKRATCDLI